MWKKGYDPSGNIEAAGGMEAYVQTTIAQEDNGFSTYTHNFVDGMHQLTSSTGGNNIKFVASTAYTEGQMFEVNGTLATPLKTDGEPLLDGAFIAGAVVNCFASDIGEEPVLYFAMGNCGDQNIPLRVFVGEKPDNPIQGDIYIPNPTIIAEPDWQISPTRPAPIAGKIWIGSNGGASTQIQVTHKPPIYIGLKVPHVVRNGVWVREPLSQMYTLGTWEYLKEFVFESGVYGINTILYAYSPSATPVYSRLNNSTGEIEMFHTGTTSTSTNTVGGNQWSGFYTEPFFLDGTHQAIKANFTRCDVISHYSNDYFGVATSLSNAQNNVFAAVLRSASATVGEKVINVDGLVGTFILCYLFQGMAQKCYRNIDRVWFE